MNNHFRNPNRTRAILMGLILLLIFLSSTIATASTAGSRQPALSPVTPLTICPHAPHNDGPADVIRIADTNNHRVQSLNMRQDDFTTPRGMFGSNLPEEGSTAVEFDQPQGIVTGPWNRTYIADTNNDRIQVLSEGLNFITAFGSSGSGNGEFDEPTGITINSSRKLYVLDTGNNRVQKLSHNGTYLAQWGSAGSGNGQFSNATGIAASWFDNNIYVADTGNDRIQKFGNNGVFLAAWGSSGNGPGQFDAPSDISVHPLTGDVYVADRGNHRVQQFLSDGTFVRQWGSFGSGNGEFNNPRSISVSPRYGVFVLDGGNGRIQLFSDTGTYLDKWGSSGSGTGEFSNAMALASNRQGVDFDKCYVHDFTLPGGLNRRITVFYTTDNGLPWNWLDDVNNPVTGTNIYAEKVAEWTETAWATYYDYNLDEPSHVHLGVSFGSGITGNEMEIWVRDIGSEGKNGSCCGAYFYQINARHVVNRVNGEERRMGETALHELFHSVQGTWGVSSALGEPKWVTEGGAGNIQDKVVTSIDTWAGSVYMNYVDSYLTSLTDNDFRDASYRGALFWTYFQEQLGNATPPDPGYGVSAVEHYFSTVDPLHGLDALAQTVESLSGNTRHLEDFWTDFTIANYTKGLGGTVAAHRYVDDDDTIYSSVPVNEHLLLGGTPGLALNESLEPYSARYFRFVPVTAPCDYVAFEMSSDERIGFTIVDHRGGNLVMQPETYWGTQRAIAFNVAGPFSTGDGIAAILTGLADPANVTLNVSCVEPALEIVSPQTGHPGLAGPYGNPGNILAYISVTAPGYGPVRGLTRSQFATVIGSETVTFYKLVELEDLYVLLLAAPPQLSDGLYDLEVMLDGTISDTEIESVLYTSQVIDNMLVIDRSGSMLTDDKIGAAQVAGNLQVTEMDINAWSGLVSFATSETLDRPLLDITIEPNRSNLRNAINGLTPGGWTAIVAGVDEALDELDSAGGADHSCNVTVLSDGMDNQSSPAEVQALINRLQNHPRGCRVYAIALGENADKLFLQELTDASGGQVYAATLTSPIANSNRTTAVNSTISAGTLSASWQNRLVSYYDDIAARQAGRNRILAAGQADFSGLDVELVPLDDSVAEAVFAINADNGVAQATELRDPVGALVDNSYPGATIVDVADHRVFKIQAPMAGEWEVRLEGTSTLGYILMTSAVSPVSLELLARAPLSTAGTGHIVPILAVLHDRTSAIAGAQVEANIQDSLGSTTHLMLYDDGQHGDGQADDGVYGNRFTRANNAPCHTDPELGLDTICDNAYQVYAVATMDEIRREAQTSFAIKAAEDGDGDGMPDAWEAANDLDPLDPDDLAQDPDEDGLTNLNEYQQGTDPQNPDTDQGGEMDGTEITGQRDPLDPRDDGVLKLRQLEARPFDGLIALSFSQQDTFLYHRVYRRPWPAGTGDWQLIADNILPTGIFSDPTVTNGNSYQYRLVTVASNGARNLSMNSLPVEPGVDVSAPEGWIQINDGAATTANRQVTLQLGWEPDVVAMRLSNQPDFAGAEWMATAVEQAWELDTTLPAGAEAQVFVEFRDAAGNISEYLEFDSILLDDHKIFLPIILRP